jgi:hypothetical protein
MYAPSIKRNRIDLELTQKREICEFVLTTKQKYTQKDIAAYFSRKFSTCKPIGRSTISEILKKRSLLYRIAPYELHPNAKRITSMYHLHNKTNMPG